MGTVEPAEELDLSRLYNEAKHGHGTAEVVIREVSRQAGTHQLIAPTCSVPAL